MRPHPKHLFSPPLSHVRAYMQINILQELDTYVLMYLGMCTIYMLTYVHACIHIQN